jgi:hypothetical protein
MNDTTKTILRNPAVGLVVAVAIGALCGWSILAVGGHTDASGRMGIAIGAGVFAFVASAWGRGRSGIYWGMGAALVVSGILFAHFSGNPLRH